MKRYTPSVNNNNNCREEVASELKAVIYRLEKGKYDAGLDGEAVAAVLGRLKEQLSDLEYSIGTGEEDIGILYEDAQNRSRKSKRCFRSL